ncbi:hypothetical protein ACH5RR_028964 [Cinchona calisaya]|uniref:Reverse transcriptase domain-containing protein n=1 Tax=Cinchona calisaya TaxID=153742 RepID=A0ABD2YQC3_9GENT
MHDVVKGYNRANGVARCVVKVDLMKAYDTLRWDFLFYMLDLMKFPPKFLGWLKNGVQTTNFSVNFNGALAGYFTSSRGLRQVIQCLLTSSFWLWNSFLCFLILKQKSMV